MNYFKLTTFYKRDVFFFYSDENVYDRYNLEKGIPYLLKEKIYYVVDKMDSYLEQYDILPTVGGILVSFKLMKLIEHLGSDCEFIPAIIKSTETGESNDSFFVMNIMNLIPCLDFKKSEYKPLVKSIPDGPIRIISIAYITGALNGHNIVRMKEAKEIIIVDETFVKSCRDLKIKGINFIQEGSLLNPKYVDLT